MASSRSNQAHGSRAKPTRSDSGADRKGRVLHVRVPDDVFKRLKIGCAESGLPFKTFMEDFLRKAPMSVRNPDSDSGEVSHPVEQI